MTSVTIGMSGGVDSSVAALLLKQQGYEVQGFTLRMWTDEGRCCSKEDIQVAIQIAGKIGIPHTIIDIRKEFEAEVVSCFLEGYRQGRTPNPCAICNQRIRFGSFWKQVDSFGAKYLATGHYARIKPVSFSGGDPETPQEELLLARAKDRLKSQEYFLSLISKEYLGRILFPLGDLTKPQVREIARDNDLPVIDRESQDICFIPGGDTARFICNHLGDTPGDIVDAEGKVLGRHRGIWCHTIGQRKGLGIAAKEPLFVVKLDMQNNRVVVGPRSALAGDHFRLLNINKFTDRNLTDLPLTCKIRYATPEVGCRIEGDEVILKHPVDAITPGQLGVTYWEDKVVMAGIIDI
ncbi:tRNA 2-thiouridine(34) synthase MnmA [candidate division WOR-3 bacterium]|nr:tRNA 2-thiouridine(34) synthase MnmA [candidate division WOR-3 bacterium]